MIILYIQVIIVQKKALQEITMEIKNNNFYGFRINSQDIVYINLVGIKKKSIYLDKFFMKFAKLWKKRYNLLH